jgi:hypothetical protein
MKKEYILEEIRRTAKQNGGAPLGVRMFLRETGIKEADWKGKHWVRWGDAVREAGFAPNKLTVAYEESALIEKFIAVMREVGRFPVVAELRMKGRSDASIPNDKTFARFGNKQQFAAKILDYCRERPGHDDVMVLCAAVVGPQRAQVGDEKETGENIGFVYLIKAGRFYKIGRSNSVGRREYELGIQLPEKAATVHAIRTDDPVGIEGYWHRRFETKRKNGEWFELNANDVAVFKRRKFM